jgi:hypothetical protein
MHMIRKARFIVPSALALLVCSIVACRSIREYAVASERALDVVLLCEDSPDAGPMLFAHRRHYAASTEGGLGIPCASCHHDYKPSSASPPKACRECHASHGEKISKSKTPL